MKYFLVTRRNGSFGVSVKELLKTKPWRDIKTTKVHGLLMVTVRLEYNVSSVYYTQTWEFSTGAELCKLVSKFSKTNAYRYGLDPEKGLVELDIVKPE